MHNWESPQALKLCNCQTHMAALNMFLSLKLSRHKPAGTDCLKAPAVPEDTRRRLLPPDSTCKDAKSLYGAIRSWKHLMMLIKCF